MTWLVSYFGSPILVYFREHRPNLARGVQNGSVTLLGVSGLSVADPRCASREGWSTFVGVWVIYVYIYTRARARRIASPALTNQRPSRQARERERQRARRPRGRMGRRPIAPHGACAGRRACACRRRSKMHRFCVQKRAFLDPEI